jgi:peptide/nickel transport system substrate-binding protein
VQTPYNSRVFRVLVSIALVLLVSCSRETPQPPSAPTAVKRERIDGGRLVRRLETDVRTLNYLLQTTEDERQVLALLYDPLIEVDQNLSPVPGIAAKWEVLDGGKAYVFHLDPRATFSDGQPVRAGDVVFTLTKILDADSLQFESYFADLDREQTKALDERTVRIAFKEARAGRLLSFNIGVMPEHVYGKEDFAKTTKVVGSGPYVLKQRLRDRSILLERRADYWRGAPSIASILFRPIKDDAVAWNAIRKGDVDVTRVNNDTWARVKNDPAVTNAVAFHDVYKLAWSGIAWNLSDPLLADIRVRRALAMAFDVRTVIDELYHGQARPVTGPFTPDSWASNPEIPAIEFNPSAATALLGSAGWRDTDSDGVLDREGKPFELALLIAAGSDASREHAQVFQESLKRIGVALEITPLDEAAFYDLVFKRNFQAAYLSWVNDPDPDPFGLFHSSQIAPDGMNVGGYSSSEADAIIDEARTELDHARRAYLYHQLHELLARDQPYLWTVQVGEKWAVRQRVRNVHVGRGVGLFLWYPDSRAWFLRD